uniref:SANT domain-containing protein n=1 Tax=Macrostomum lignano TaxID=282301 RepID=A0A1I8F7D1_9PLAT
SFRKPAYAREFKQDPESLLRLVAVLDRLRHLPTRPVRCCSCPPAFKKPARRPAKDMQTQARSSLEDFRDEIVKDGAAQVAAVEAARRWRKRRSRGGISAAAVLRQTAPCTELTLKVAEVSCQQLHDFGDTAHEILARENAASSSMRGRQQQQPASNRRRKTRCLAPISGQTLANLLADSGQPGLSTTQIRLCGPFSCSIIIDTFRTRLERLQKCGAASLLELGGEVASVAAPGSGVVRRPTNGSVTVVAGIVTGILGASSASAPIQSMPVLLSSVVPLCHWARVLEIVMEKNKPLSQQRMASEMPGKVHYDQCFLPPFTGFLHQLLFNFYCAFICLPSTDLKSVRSVFNYFYAVD